MRVTYTYSIFIRTTVKSEKSLIIHGNVNSLNYFIRQMAAAQLILKWQRVLCVYSRKTIQFFVAECERMVCVHKYLFKTTE